MTNNDHTNSEKSKLTTICPCHNCQYFFAVIGDIGIIEKLDRATNWLIAADQQRSIPGTHDGLCFEYVKNMLQFVLRVLVDKRDQLNNDHHQDLADEMQ